MPKFRNIPRPILRKNLHAPLIDPDTFLPTNQIIDLAKKAGVDFGPGDPTERIRYFIKLGILPHVTRKSLKGDPKITVGHLPYLSVKKLIEVNRLYKKNLSYPQIAHKLTQAKESKKQEASASFSPTSKPIAKGESKVIYVQKIGNKDINDKLKLHEEKVQKIVQDELTSSLSFGKTEPDTLKSSALDTKLITTQEVISRTKGSGVSFGNGDPFERIRHLIKLGILPHAVRKTVKDPISGIEKTIGHLPEWSIKRLLYVHKLHQNGLIFEQIANKVKKLEKAKLARSQEKQALATPDIESSQTTSPKPSINFFPRVGVTEKYIDKKLEQYQANLGKALDYKLSQAPLNLEPAVLAQSPSRLASITKGLFVTAALTSFISIGVYSARNYVSQFQNSQEQLESINTSSNLIGQVLAASSDAHQLYIDANTEVSGTTLFSEDITAPNVLYGAVGGTGITVSAGQTPTLSVDNTAIVTSVNNLAGGLTISGSGATSISASGSTITISSTDSGDSDTTLSESAVEAFIFDADAESITGVWEVQDDVAFVFGNDANINTLYNETDDLFNFKTALTGSQNTDYAVYTFATDTTNAGMTANQEVFEIGRGGSDDSDATYTELFSLDEDGDGVFAGAITVSSCTGCASAWSSLTDPTTDLSLSHGTNATTMTTSATTQTFWTYTGAAFTTGEILDVTGTWAPTDGSTNEAIDINLTHTPTTSADVFTGIDLNVTEGANALANTTYGLASTVDNSANTSTGTHSIYGGYFTATGKTAGTTTGYGIYATATGADTNYAGYFAGDIGGYGDLTITANTALNPTIAGSVNDATNLESARDVYVSGRYAYVAAYTGDRLTVVDISNPTSPTVVGNVNDATNLDGAMGVYVSGRYAYVAAYTGDRLTVVDISNPTSPTVVGNVNDATNLDGARDVYVSGRYAYVTATLADRLTVVDISNPTSPTVVGNVNDATNLDGAYGVYVSGRYAYVSTDFIADRLTVVDISNPTSPTVVGNVNDATNLNGGRGVYVSGRYAYVAVLYSDRLTVVDISNPTSPTVVGNVNDATNLDGAYGVYVSGKYAYVAAKNGNRLTVVDISNPTSPTVVGNVNDATNLNDVYDVYVSGKYAYVSSGAGDRLTVVDVTGIDVPTITAGNLNASTIDTWDNLNVGNNLYVRNGIHSGDGGLYSSGPLSIYNQNTLTSGTTSNYGLYNSWSSTAVVTGTAQTAFGAYNSVSKTGADTSTAATTIYGQYSVATNTGATDAGTKNTYGGYFSATGDTAGTSSAYGIYTTASGADTGYGLFVDAGSSSNNYGIYIVDQNGGATSDYGIYIEGSDSYSIYSAADDVAVVLGADDKILVDASTTTNTTFAGIIDLDVTSAISGNRGIDIDYNFTGGLNTRGYGIYSDYTATGTSISYNYGIYQKLAVDTAGNKWNYGLYSDLDIGSATASQSYGAYLNVSSDGLATSNTFSVYGANIHSGAITSGTKNVYGIYTSADSDSTASGGTSNAYGGFLVGDGDTGGTGTAFGIYANAIGADNGYGTYIANGTSTTNYGAYIVDQTGGTTDYGLAIAGADSQALWLSSGANSTDAANGIAFGSSRDTNLYRVAASTLRTDDTLHVSDGSDFIYLYPSAGTTPRLSFRDGASTTRFCWDTFSSLMRLFSSTSSDACTGGATVNLQIGLTTFNANLHDVSTYTQRLCHSGANGAQDAQNISDCQATGQADFAEYYGSEEQLEPGEIVIADGEATETVGIDNVGHASKSFVKRSTSAYQSETIGIVSTNPFSEILSSEVFEENENPTPIALSGRVPVKVSSENGPIITGDFITSSTQPGIGMKAIEAGRVIGVALSSYSSDDPEETGSVIAFVNPTFYLGTNIASSGSIYIDPIQENTGETDDILVADNQTNPDGTVNCQLSIVNCDLNGQLLTAGQVQRLVELEVEEQIADLYQVSSEPTIESEATDSAQLADETQDTLSELDDLLTTTDLSLDTLQVAGQSNLASTQVAGTLSQDGTLIIDYGNQINVLASTLFLQSDSLSGSEDGILLDIGSGKATIDNLGNLVITGTLKASNIETSKLTLASDSESQTVGSSSITTGSSSQTIQTTALEPNAKILITPRTPTGGKTIFVSESADFESFTVAIEQGPATTDIQFDWLIVNSRELSQISK